MNVSNAPPSRWATIPNAICVGRILATPLLLAFAARGERWWVIGLFLAMTASDWIDGKLAVWLDQRSAFGARLDSFADALMYLALVLAALLLDAGRLAGEWPWLALALGSYLAAGIYGRWKLGRWPSHHTRVAKISWLLVGVGAVVYLADGPSSWLRVGLVAVTVGNGLSLAISSVLPEWRSDVGSLAEARRIRDERRRQGDGGSRSRDP